MTCKKCNKCGESYPLSGFYKSTTRGDGRDNTCKECRKAAVRANWNRKMKEDPEWRIRERARCREKQRRYVAEGKHKLSSKPRAVIPKQKHATTLVRRAILSGKIPVKPCEVCGHKKAQAHHEDYDKPLDVFWLCTRHHGDRHIYLRDCEDLQIPPTPIHEWATLPLSQLEH